MVLECYKLISEDPTMALLGRLKTERDMEHVITLAQAGAMDLLVRVRDGKIAPRDAVGVMKRRYTRG